MSLSRADPITRLQVLERTVAALVAGKAGPRRSEAHQSTILQVNPSTGLVTAFFPGGVQMNEQTASTYSAVAAVGWLDSAGGGQIREHIIGVSSVNQHLLYLQANPDAADAARVILQTSATGALGSANVGVVVQDAGGGSASITVIDSKSQSNFLQAVSLQQLAANVGTATFTGNGTATVAAIAVNHGLGRTPKAVVGIPARSSGGTVWIGDVNESGAPSTTQFTATAHHSDAGTFTAATTYAFYWIAIG